jgi:putative nucleotidyltransferase with HDIG domain
MKTGSLQLFIILLFALITANLFYFLYPESTVYPDREYVPGQIAEEDIVAPFDFPVIKDSSQISTEQHEAAATATPVYRLDGEMSLRVVRRLDDLFTMLGEGASTEALNKAGYTLSSPVSRVLEDSRQRVRLYNFLQEELKPMLANGILPDNAAQEIQYVDENGETKVVPSSRFISVSVARQRIFSHLSNATEQEAVREILAETLSPTMMIDSQNTERLRSEAREAVSHIQGEVTKGELIVARNQRIGDEEYTKIRSLIAAKQERIKQRPFGLVLSTMGVFLLSLSLQFLFLHLLRGFFPREADSPSKWLVFEIGLLVPVLGLIAIYRGQWGSDYLIPMALSPLVVAQVFSPSVGILFTFFQWVLPVCFLNWGSWAPLEWTFSIVTVLVVCRSLKLSSSIILSFALLLLSYSLWSAVFALTRHETYLAIHQRFYGYGSLLFCGAVAILIIPLVERALGLVTRQMLLNLLDFNNPLLKRLAGEAPGTYSHSLVVGNLAESAAESIGANSLLARVASYYHDIGKLEAPMFYTENNPNSSELHNELSSVESAGKIREHVSLGMAQLKKSRIPAPVIDILRQHHGTRAVAYFLDKARKSGEPVDESKYRYPGPKPQSRESALVMIADIVESRVKSLMEPTEQAMRRIIDDTVQTLIIEGQLDEAPITLRELETAKTALLPVLKGIHNRRIEYPGN